MHNAGDLKGSRKEKSPPGLGLDGVGPGELLSLLVLSILILLLFLHTEKQEMQQSEHVLF